MWVCRQQWRETLVGILKRVIVTLPVYSRFFEFLHVNIQSTGHTLLRPWSRQPNDAMSAIVCAQLHNELLGRRHSTLQSHGLFALAKHLCCIARGVRQGAVLSPYLFQLYIRHLLKSVVGCNIGFNIAECLVNILAFAEDMVLMAPSWRGLQCLLDITV